MFMTDVFPAMNFEIKLINHGDPFTVEALNQTITVEFELLVARPASKTLCVVEWTVVLDSAWFTKWLLAFTTFCLHSIKNKY